ncbi:GtrA family protein [Dactylosporangium sp. NPDC000555]|uniref:GtrA family protein n=1 Tax=Dactylosporangium sp. NPDC000555 TaxID=3154260 RepID=UPI003328B195
MTLERKPAERLGDFLTSWVQRLPPRLRRVLPRELVGFAMLGAFTFCIDLAVLAMLRRWTHLPMPVAVSIAYVGAFGLNFVLNRTVNFRSHAPVGGQILRYAVVILGDFLITVTVTTGLSTLGLDFRVARVLASFIVAVFTYSASRWWVFRDRPARTEPSVPAAATAGPADDAVAP